MYGSLRLLGRAVHFGGGAEHQPARGTVRANRFGDVHRADGVREKRAARIEETGRGMALRGKMKNSVERHFLHHARDGFIIGKVAEMKLQRVEHAVGHHVANIVFAAIRVANEPMHFVALADEKVGEMRPDESGDSRDQIAHASVRRSGRIS